jgi:ribose transport system ATP-binding protein
MTKLNSGAVVRLAPQSFEGEPGLEINGVWKRFGPVTAVKNVSLAARRGEVHALLGENGAGKSTLMAIAAGALEPDEGTVSICSQRLTRASIGEAHDLGLALVHQHPAVLPDLTVTENMLLAVPKAHRQGYQRDEDWVRAQLQQVGSTADPFARLADVDIAQSHLIELAKALAVKPKVLILDEPTAALTANLVDILFENIRKAAAGGATIIYISHRLQEIRQIADAVTVMRDGEVKGGGAIDELSDEEILQLIVGRSIKNTYPPKLQGPPDAYKALRVTGLSGPGFSNVNLTVRAGEIVGIAGITGNGQSEFLRALAGLIDTTGGSVGINDETLKLGSPSAARSSGIIYLSPERQREGVFRSLSVRENASVSALSSFAKFGIVNRSREATAVEEQREKLKIRTSTIEQQITTLSGGNQQKVMMARALLGNARVILAEEPTAGVDMGARADIYDILRKLASDGTIVIVVSSDIMEVEGLCDRVVVFSRGHIVGELQGKAVTENAIGRAMISATSVRHSDADQRKAGIGSKIGRLMSGDLTPIIVLSALIVLLTIAGSSYNIRFISAFNIEKVLYVAAALAFVSFGQLCAVLTGRIDLSVGPLVGLSVIIGSFYLNDGAGVAISGLGIVLILLAAIALGIVNGALIRFANFTAVAATIGTYIILQGISVLLRPFPDGAIGSAFTDGMKASLSSVPVVFIAAVVVAFVLDYALRKSRWGMNIRAIGSNESAAAHIGVNVSRSLVGAYIACSTLTAIGGLIVVALLGIGDPNQGLEFTLSSTAAVVLGGASLLGGRGSFVGVLLGALLIQLVNSSMVFLGLSQAWQYWFIGLLTIIGVAVYSQAARRSYAS